MTVREAFEWLWKIVVIAALVGWGYELGKWAFMWTIYFLMT